MSNKAKVTLYGLGVILVVVLVGWASSRWPQQAQAFSASLGFLTAGLLVYITWKYVGESKKIRELMEEQWKEPKRVHVSFWLKVDATPQSSFDVVYKRDFDVTGSGLLLVPAVNLCVFNAGPHAFRLRRVRLKSASASVTGRTIERTIVVGAEKTESLNIAAEMLQVISSSAVIEFEKVCSHIEDLEIALDCSGLYEEIAPTRVFRIETKEGKGRLEITVAERRENGSPP